MALPAGRRKAANVTLLTSLVEGKSYQEICTQFDYRKSYHQWWYVCYYVLVIIFTKAQTGPVIYLLYNQLTVIGFYYVKAAKVDCVTLNL